MSDGAFSDRCPICGERSRQGRCECGTLLKRLRAAEAEVTRLQKGLGAIANTRYAPKPRPNGHIGVWDFETGVWANEIAWATLTAAERAATAMDLDRIRTAISELIGASQ